MARVTGKDKSEISRLLSILELESDVQSVAREDQTGSISKRHLYALARLAPDQQHQMLVRTRRDNLTALDLERYVARERKRQNQPGAPVTYRRFSTKHASVVLTFRKRDVSDDDVLFALSEIKKQITHNAALYEDSEMN